MVVINIVRSYKALRDTKIAVITGHPELITGTRDASRVDLILNKPISNEKLLETVNQFAVESF